MNGRWRWSRFNHRVAMILLVFSCIMFRSFCSSVNNEGLALLKLKERVKNDPFGALSSWKYNNGDGDLNHCFWFGVECADGKVVVLNLRDLCLEGTLAPDIGRLVHIKSINIRNNSFSGAIPKEIGELKELEVLDLGCNNFSGPFPSVFGKNFALSILLVDNNDYISIMPHELHNLKEFSESQVDENLLSNAAGRVVRNSQSSMWKTGNSDNRAERKLLQLIGSSNPIKAKSNQVSNRDFGTPSPSPTPLLSPHVSSPARSPFQSISTSPSPFISSQHDFPSPSPSQVSAPSFSLPPVLPLAPALPPQIIDNRHQHHPAPAPSHASMPSPTETNTTKNSNNPFIFILAGVTGASLFTFVTVLGIVYCRRNKVVSVKPWATGLSGQLQKAFVAGVPKLQSSELETACEDFSNIIGSLSDSTIYKGTLSSGIEIAVAVSEVKSAEHWTNNLQAQFRDKIDILSKVNHKNFLSLIGYCEEEVPFTRMMVFEYAPNGTLFEHLHIKESEHLDWAMRLRIAMGVAYCLEYMHELNQPVALKNLHSSSVYLTEDYAAKIADFSFWNEVTKTGTTMVELLEVPSADPETNIYDFGMILLEMITGRFPNSTGNDSLADWALLYLKEEQPLVDVIDPTLRSYQEEDVKKLLEVVKDCIQPDPRQRPNMRELTIMLKEITALGPDAATPKLSPLWWAELEILSTESG